MKRIVLIISISLVLGACSSGQKSPEWKPSDSVLPPDSKPTTPAEKVEEVIDFRALQTSLRMDGPREELGYREKQFNTCEVGAGFSSSSNCRRLTFVRIHFHLLCRDSDGTVSEVVTEANLQPIANQSIQWILGKASNVVSTDSNGYGQIVIATPESQRGQRLRLTSRNDFLALRAGEIKTVVAPKNWCQ